MNYFASLVSRHYILVLRAEGSNWFYICKRAVKLSWLSFQYFNTGPPLLQIFMLAILFLCVYFKLCQVSIRFSDCPSHASVPRTDHSTLSLVLDKWTEPDRARPEPLGGKYPGPNVKLSIKTLEHKHDPQI